MDSLLSTFYAYNLYIGIAVALILMLVFSKFIARMFGIVVIPDDSIGVVTKKFVAVGRARTLPPGRVVATNGEAGYQADTLPPGLHFGLWPWQFIVHKEEFVEIPADHVGLVEAIDGEPLPSGRIVARKVECDFFQDAKAFLTGGGQRGPQMTLIPPGVYRINPLLFNLTMIVQLVVEAGKIGIVQARDGKPLSPGRILAKRVDCDAFQDAGAFMDGAGERGTQPQVVTPGTYRINPAMFEVTQVSTVDVPDGKVGIVTTREGAALPAGEIAGPVIPGHNMFQDPATFVSGGGNKGLQEQVLQSGRYFINPQFATVQLIDMTLVPIASVGVVVSFVGPEGVDVTGAEFKHGNLVAKGQRGVWVDPLDPGRYPINTFTHNVSIVPTANVVLNWATGKSEAHKLDKDLSTITVRSADGFKFNLDVSQIIHIPRCDAPKVIARFGTVGELVTQVLEPIIGNYFRNAAQSSDAIEFLKHRTERQQEARLAISAALTECNVGAVDTLIGDISPPEALMKTLTDRKIAEQEKITYTTQKESQATRQEFEQAQALAATQATVVASERKVAIAEFDAKSNIAEAEGQAASRVINAKADAQVRNTLAEADANVVKVVGNAEAAKTLAIGTAEADVIKLKINSMEAGNYATVQVAQALAASGHALVPEVMAGGSAGGQGGTIVDLLLAGLIKDRITKPAA